MHSPSSTSARRRIFSGGSRRLRASAVVVLDRQSPMDAVAESPGSNAGSEASREGPGLEGAVVEDVPTSVGGCAAKAEAKGAGFLGVSTASVRARGVAAVEAGAQPQATA
mmetsp:Transcript_53161/g.164731  ORF Transcript_53161/g.164731 Transcript_53161/m.164731 type:complete len:110 (-) Transcript_53161:1088-1417(-)